MIGQVIAIGDMKPYNVALITLDPDVAPAYTQQHGEDCAAGRGSRAGWRPPTSRWPAWRQIKRYKVLETDWQPGGDELTPTMKLKRKPIHEKYATEIEELYS